LALSEASWWDEEYDVVVVGGGGAGLIAAVEAADTGAKVLLIEKQPGLGGATGMSVGSITAAGTALQAKAGITDSVDAHYADLLTLLKSSQRGGEEYDLDLSRLMVEVAPGAVQRLSALGVQFSGPHPEPPHAVYRMHNAVPDSGAYIDVLTRAATERGVIVRTETAVQELQRDEGGAVSALSLRHVRGSQTRAVKVRRAVILAAGDFSGNEDLARANGRPSEVSAVDPIRPYATGDGVLVATAIGAGTVAMHRTGGVSFRTVLPPYCAPNRELFLEGAILVNRDGQRFTNELGAAALDTNKQPGKTAYVVFDSRLAARIAVAEDDAPPSRDGWYRKGKLSICTFPGVGYAYIDDLRRATQYFFEAPSIGELAEQMQIPQDALRSDIESYNRVPEGQDDAFGRKRCGPGIVEPPFYAVGPVKPFIIFSGGGLAVDREMRVLDTARRPIPRLYACGANAEAGVFLGGHGHHLAWAFGTGQVAGRNASAERPL
jgi:succinate dehydrogenase/fumarate reductase flavoprotein subunit